MIEAKDSIVTLKTKMSATVKQQMAKEINPRAVKKLHNKKESKNQISMLY